jgi:PIN domain nuclease of toxin-antitoxin system
VILLDTHVWVWLAMDSKRLSRAALAAIRRATAAGGISVASISLWELATLFDQGRIRAPGTIESSVRQVVDSTSVVVHEITPEVAALATAFPQDFSADPADRLIGATARSLGLPLVTRDQRMLESSLLKAIW